MVVPGARCGPFEVLERIGAGGMGDVFRARDTRLDRIVALKTIRAPELAGPDRLERFKREAYAISRLSHPHICALYDIGELDGEAFLVMEYVDGETLARRLQRGPLTVNDVLRYGLQMASALDAAHRRGVIHRDLKPSNVMLTRHGVKLLDFGLAKLHAAESNTPENTTTLGISEPGIVLGSLPYMAPEQLESKSVDARADLFALGVVLYEMVTGEPPFRESSKASLISAILSKEPTAPATLRPAIPPLLDRTIRRCLAKLPDERWQTAADLLADLQYLTETHRGPAPAPPRALGPAAGRALFAAILTALAIWIVWQVRSGKPALIAASQRPVGPFGASYRQATISPDGGLIAFTDAGRSTTHIWIKNLKEGDPVQITSGDERASHPTWSPRNDAIVFARTGQGLWSVPPLGGSARQLLEFGQKPQFSADGERLVFERNEREVWLSRADGSEAARVRGIPTPWYRGNLDPALSPDGSSIVFFMPEVGANGDFWIVPSSGGTPRQLTRDLTEADGPTWTPDGRFIIFSSMRGGSRTLWRVEASGGTPEPVTAGAGEDLEPTVSRDGGTLVYTNVRNQYVMRALDPDTRTERVIVARRRQAIFPRVSSDGSMVVFFGFGDVGDVQIFAIPMSGGAVQQLTYGHGQINAMPRWSPDGSLVYYYQQRPVASFRSIRARGGASHEVRPWKWESHTYAELSPDGTLIAYFRHVAPGERDIAEGTVIEEVTSGERHRTELPIVAPRWSRDGQTLLGHIRGRPPVIATCPADGTTCRQLTTGILPVWSHDNSQIYFLRDTAVPSVKELWSMTPDGGNQRRLFDAMGPYRGIDVTFDVSPNGEIVWSGYLEGRHELWQAALRP